jgi:hypothetical protein
MLDLNHYLVACLGVIFAGFSFIFWTVGWKNKDIGGMVMGLITMIPAAVLLAVGIT